MNRLIAAAAAAVLLATPVFASGDAEMGAKAFNKCKACHTVASADGDVVVKGGKTGPNLFGLAGRTAGTYEGYKYSPSLAAAGEAGLVWDEETFVAFAADPKGFLQGYLDDSKAKSKMSFKLKKGGEDIWTFLSGAGS